MLRIVTGTIIQVLVIVALHALGFAQEPKVDSKTWFEDDSKLGFKIKVPKDWEFIPPQPGEEMLVGRYEPKFRVPVTIGKGEEIYLGCWLVVFDRRPKPEEEEEEPEVDEDGVRRIVIRFSNPYKDVVEWVTRSNAIDGAAWHVTDEDKLKIKGVVSAKQIEFTGLWRGFSWDGVKSDEVPEVKAYAAVYELEKDLELALVFNGPGERKKWIPFRRAFEKMGKSLERVEIVSTAELLGENMPVGNSPRAKKKAKLLDEIRRTPGWELYETPNYLIISNNDDKEFIEDLKTRLEAIREIYERDYPPEAARRVANKPKTGPDSENEDDKDEKRPPDEEEREEEVDENRSVSVVADPFELSRTSVVRVCKDADQYYAYGGPGGSAGYWASYQEELVVYDDKAVGGRADTWAVVNHEAFHQYIYYFYGQLAPHSWYNEGTGDFYAGYEYKHGRFDLEPFAWRVQTVKTMLKEERYVPLQELVRYSQGDYYGESPYGTVGGEHYAQGWSFIYFMREGRRKSPRWNEAWDHILDTYLETLAETADLDRAVDVAFDRVDWQELETAWKEFTL